MTGFLLAADDGLVNGNLDLADILFLIAVILFVLAAVILGPLRKAVEAWVGSMLLAIGLACVALAWLVL